MLHHLQVQVQEPGYLRVPVVQVCYLSADLTVVSASMSSALRPAGDGDGGEAGGCGDGGGCGESEAGGGSSSGGSNSGKHNAINNDDYRHNISL